MNAAFQWGRKWMLKLALAVLATCAGCKSPPQPQTYAQWQYNGPRLSVRDFIVKTSDIGAARYGKSSKAVNGTAPANVNIQKDPHPSTE